MTQSLIDTGLDGLTTTRTSTDGYNASDGELVITDASSVTLPDPNNVSAGTIVLVKPVSGEVTLSTPSNVVAPIGSDAVYQGSDAVFVQLSSDGNYYVRSDLRDVVAYIPDSVVSRPSDNTSSGSSNTTTYGAQITTDVEWPDIGGKISANTSGMTKAYVYRVSDGSLLGSTDISGLSAGDTFTVTGVNLQPHDGTDTTTYNFVMDGGGSGWTHGYYDSPSFPYVSSDGDLSIAAVAKGQQGSQTGFIGALSSVGDVGF
jgi:hypothetical protein